MDRLWTPWRYAYITGQKPAGRQGVPESLADWPGADKGCVFCNLIAAVEWGLSAGRDDALQAGHILTRHKYCFVCLNAFPYSTGHVLILPYRHTDSLAKLDPAEAMEMMSATQRMETALRKVYQPDGINLGINLGEAAGAGVAAHLHQHILPRWFGDTNFMTITAETRILPETLDTTWIRLSAAISET